MDRADPLNRRDETSVLLGVARPLCDTSFKHTTSDPIHGASSVFQIQYPVYAHALPLHIEFFRSNGFPYMVVIFFDRVYQ